MTGYTVHTGSNDKFSSGWDRIFQVKKKGAAASKSASTPAPAKPAKGKPGKKKT
jgi:hypothetical protein